MSLVLELQHEALDPNVSVAVLLRKALVVVKKLDIKEFEGWIELELNGYKGGSTVPDYRIITGTVMGHNPYQGWQPLIFQDDKTQNTCSTRGTTQSISELEQLIDKSKNSIFQMYYPAENEQILRKAIGFDVPIALHVSAACLHGIVDKVRNIVLNWALKLEKDGITGEGMTFSKEEKDTAAKHTYNVNNFYAPVSNQQIQQGNESATQHITNTGLDATTLAALKTLVADLRGNIANLGISSDQAAELEADIGTIECQTNSTKPKTNILKESLASIRKILESAMGGVAANQIYTRIPEILQLLG